jgi:hypothetical protein
VSRHPQLVHANRSTLNYVAVEAQAGARVEGGIRKHGQRHRALIVTFRSPRGAERIWFVRGVEGKVHEIFEGDVSLLGLVRLMVVWTAHRKACIGRLGSCVQHMYAGSL